MAVYIDRLHLEICDRIGEELNRSAKLLTTKDYPRQIEKYEADIFRKNLSLESKKKQMTKNLHRMIVDTFAEYQDNAKSKKDFIIRLNKRLGVLRNTVMKLRDINYFLSAIFLKEINIIKSTKKSLNKDYISERDTLEDGHLNKRYLDRLEVTVYRLIERVIFLDQKLMKRYKARGIKLVGSTKTGVSELGRIISRQSEILCHIEAKLPPPEKFRNVLLRKEVFTEWVSRIFALLAGFEYEYHKEFIIMERLKKNKKIRDKLKVKIIHLIKEKFALMKIREKKLLMTDSGKKILKEHHIIANKYASALRL